MAHMLICLVDTGEGVRDDKDDLSRVQVPTSTFNLAFLHLCF